MSAEAAYDDEDIAGLQIIDPDVEQRRIRAERSRQWRRDNAGKVKAYNDQRLQQDNDDRRFGSGVTEATTSEYQSSAANDDYLVPGVVHRSAISAGTVTITARQWADAVGYSFEKHRYLTDEELDEANR